jgi:hypothetical protein
MDIKSEYRDLTEKIFESKKEFHKEKAKLPVEEKIRILIELQKIAIEANPDKAKGKRVWKI